MGRGEGFSSILRAGVGAQAWRQSRGLCSVNVVRHGIGLLALLGASLALNCQASQPVSEPAPVSTPNIASSSQDAQSVAPAASTGVRVDLDVDTDRDGRVTDGEDEAGEDLWTRERGALFMVNFDDDDLDGAIDGIDFNSAGEPVKEDLVINGPLDAQDVTPLVIRLGASSSPESLRVLLSTPSLDQVKGVHLFAGIDPGRERLWGGPLETVREIDVTPWVSFGSATTFGIEGLFFRYTQPGAYGVYAEGYGGLLDLRLTVVNAQGEEVGNDAVRLKVAPLLLLPSTQPAEELWMLSYDRPDDPATLFEDESAYNGVFENALEASGLLRVYSEGGDRWSQDHVEFGYTHAPGRPKTRVALIMPRKSRVTWPRDHLLGRDSALLQFRDTVKLDAGSGVGDFGGNVDVLPPTGAWPTGRIVVGDSISPRLLHFLQDQEVQVPITLDVSWLASEHIDDLVGFLPTSGDEWSVITADPSLALGLLDELPGEAVLFTSGVVSAGRLLPGPDGASVTLEPSRVHAADRTPDGTRYLRVYAGTGTGQVARVLPMGDGRMRINRVWQMPKAFHYLPGHPNSGDQCVWECTDRPRVPTGDTWFVEPDASSRYVMVEDTLFWRDEQNHPVPALVTVKELRDDLSLRRLNSRAAERIEAAKGVIEDAAEGPVRFIPVPVVFMGLFSTESLVEGNAAPLTPNLANFQSVGDNIYFPAHAGPRRVGEDADAFSKEATTRIPGDQEVFVDVWDYHRLLGAVHCGTNVRRAAFAFDWWLHQP